MQLQTFPSTTLPRKYPFKLLVLFCNVNLAYLCKCMVGVCHVYDFVTYFRLISPSKIKMRRQNKLQQREAYPILYLPPHYFYSNSPFVNPSNCMDKMAVTCYNILCKVRFLWKRLKVNDAVAVCRPTSPMLPRKYPFKLLVYCFVT